VSLVGWWGGGLCFLVGGGGFGLLGGGGGGGGLFWVVGCVWRTKARDSGKEKASRERTAHRPSPRTRQKRFEEEKKKSTEGCPLWEARFLVRNSNALKGRANLSLQRKISLSSNYASNVTPSGAFDESPAGSEREEGEKKKKTERWQGSPTTTQRKTPALKLA